ncbi:bacterio-opsin activator domain-containing protein [Natrononativus amylolyticus]|uniref:bacterio-opsin activator domain-containing protein n=1 Tax=Natrononativus amylolyticus TaxID=2963434 RepID=UPI0020CF47C7|nr:bacterio-opsin activator domain-containing protein [Natrononativus amylolyticus]
MVREASDADRLTRPRYDRLLDAAETYREALVVRLCGEVGLRPAELARLTPSAVVEASSEPARYLLVVPSSDGGRSRRAYLPATLERELRRYVRSNDIGADERVFDVTPRRLQMLAAAVADRASDRFDDPGLGAVSTSDLRRFFARTALVDDGINPRVVKAVGGWRSFEALEPYLPEPTDAEIVAAFAAVEDGASRTTRSGASAGDDRPGETGEDPHSGPAGYQQAITDIVLEASSHEELETGACEVLADSTAYEAAWIERTSGPARSRRRPREWRTAAGIAAAEIDRLEDATGDESESADPDPEGEPRPPAARSESVPASITVEGAVGGEVGGDRFEGALARVPIGYGDTVYGTLSVVTDRDGAFSPPERDRLETVGRQLGHAIAAVRRRTLLLSDTLLELEFTVRDDRSFFVDASSRLGCRFELDSLVSVSETTQLYYVSLSGAPPADVFDLAEADTGIDDCRLIETYEGGWRVEFVVEGSSPTLTLSEYGVTVTDAVVDDGIATITAECAADADLRTIVGGLRSVFPTSELRGKREVERTVQTAREFRAGLEERLTDRQETTLRAAYFGGYYDWPRESTAEELADAMGISSPTLHSHLRKGQHELLRTFFDDEAVDSRTRG